MVAYNAVQTASMYEVQRAARKGWRRYANPLRRALNSHVPAAATLRFIIFIYRGWQSLSHEQFQMVRKCTPTCRIPTNQSVGRKAERLISKKERVFNRGAATLICTCRTAPPPPPDPRAPRSSRLLRRKPRYTQNPRRFPSIAPGLCSSSSWLPCIGPTFVTMHLRENNISSEMILQSHDVCFVNFQ